MNHTRFPKEDHLPDWARRDNKVTKGYRVESITKGVSYSSVWYHGPQGEEFFAFSVEIMNTVIILLCKNVKPSNSYELHVTEGSTYALRRNWAFCLIMTINHSSTTSPAALNYWLRLSWPTFIARKRHNSTCSTQQSCWHGAYTPFVIPLTGDGRLTELQTLTLSHSACMKDHAELPNRKTTSSFNLLETNVKLSYSCKSSSEVRLTLPFSYTKTKQEILYRKINAVFSPIHTKHITKNVWV